MKCNTHGEAKTCLNAIALVSLGLLLASPHGHAADRNAAGAGTTWLPLTQASSPSKIAELRRDILTFLEPLRRKLFGDPDAVLTTAYFVSISPAGASQNVFPSATSTNVDGTSACVLSASQFSLLRHLLDDRLPNNPNQSPLAAARCHACAWVDFTVRQTGGQCLCTFCASLSV